MPEQLLGQCFISTEDGRFALAYGFSDPASQRHYVRVCTGPGTIHNSATPITVTIDATDCQGEIELADLSEDSILDVDPKIGIDNARAINQHVRRWFVTRGAAPASNA